MDLPKIQKAITRKQLGGWLLFNFEHRNSFSDRLLGIPQDRMNSRRWFYFIPPRGEPTKVCHFIEKDSLKEPPGRRVCYSSQAELRKILSPLACRCAAAYSDSLAALSFLDHGTARLLEGWGFQLESAESLIQETLGTLNPRQMAAHEGAAAHLYKIVLIIWERICAAFRENIPLEEMEVQNWILREFENRHLESSHAPIVAAGPNSGNPHYEPEEPSRPLSRGDILQLDLWAKQPGPEGVYADISWVGFLGEEAPPSVEKTFSLLRDARDRGVAMIKEALAAENSLTGAEVDREVRRVIIENGEGAFLRHRTGHGIDAELHGWGVNLDSLEFPDHRNIREGSCFSIEPGLYRKEYGCRTEINAYIRQGRIAVSGGPVQKKLLLLS